MTLDRSNPRLAATAAVYGWEQTGTCAACDASPLVLGTQLCSEHYLLAIDDARQPGARQPARITSGERAQHQRAVRVLALRVIAERKVDPIDTTDPDDVINAAIHAGFVAEVDGLLVPGHKAPAKVSRQVRARGMRAEVEAAGGSLTYEAAAERLRLGESQAAHVRAEAVRMGLLVREGGTHLSLVEPAPIHT